jgi:hypothetical protein
MMRQSPSDFETWVIVECFKLFLVKRTTVDDLDNGWAEGNSSGTGVPHVSVGEFLVVGAQTLDKR